MINIEKERISNIEFKTKCENLDPEQVLYVRKILESLLGEEYLFIIKEFLPEYKKKE